MHTRTAVRRLASIAACLALASLVACDDNRANEEIDDARADDTSSADGGGDADDTGVVPDIGDPEDAFIGPDTRDGDDDIVVPDIGDPEDAFIGPDTRDGADSGDTADAPDTADACEPPVRIDPTTAGAAGYDLIDAEGGEFLLGALGWWLVLDNGSDTPVWVGPDYRMSRETCHLPFTLPPLSPGDYSATVLYGWPPDDQNPGQPSGTDTITIESATQPWDGATPCQSDADCTAEDTRCEIGLGFCAPTTCIATRCLADRICDPLEGCMPEPPACTTDADCAMLYSTCGCMAVHQSDPRVDASTGQGELTKCELGACMDCVTNSCTTPANDGTTIQAACDTDTGRCIEVRR